MRQEHRRSRALGGAFRDLVLRGSFAAGGRTAGRLGIVAVALLPRGRAMTIAVGRIVDQAVIVLGMLQEVLAGDTIASGVGVARQSQILLQHLIGIAPDPDIRSIAVEGLLLDVDVRLPGAATTRPPIIRTLSHLTVTITWLVLFPRLQAAPRQPNRGGFPTA